MIFNNLIPRIYNRIFATNTNFDSEEKRIKNLDRYKFGESNLFGDTISFCDAMTFLYGGKEILQNEIYRFNSSNKTPYIIDCGSNIGLSILYFKKLYPDSIILGFEPDPMIFKILKKNVQRLGYNDVSLEQKAIWTNNDGIKFNSEGGFSGRIAYQKDTSNIINVPSKRLKELLNVKVDFLKIDIEGAENEVFFDIESSLSNVDKLFLEYHSYSAKPQMLHEMLLGLSKNGYRYHITEAFNRLKPFIDRDTMLGMDLQVNIYAYRE